MGDQAPAQPVQDILVGGRTADDWNVGSWGDVVARGKVSALAQVKEPGYFIGASGEGKATAHFLDQLAFNGVFLVFAKKPHAEMSLHARRMRQGSGGICRYWQVAREASTGCLRGRIHHPALLGEYLFRGTLGAPPTKRIIAVPTEAQTANLLLTA